MSTWYSVDCPNCGKKTMDCQKFAETPSYGYYYAVCHNCGCNWDFKKETNKEEDD